MMCRIFFVLLILNGTVCLFSCVEFNTCALKSGPVIGEAAMDFDIRSDQVRSQEYPIGNLVADSIFWRVHKRCENLGENQCPDLAVINAGAIRQESACGIRTSISKGPIYRSDIEELLPFANDLVLVRLSGQDIKLIFEHAVKNLGRSSGSATSTHFLHVAGISFDVDCKKPPLTVSEDGLRIARAGNRVANIRLGSANTDRLLDLNRYYNIATTSFLAQGNDGFLAFLQRDQENNVIMGINRQPLTLFNPKSDMVLDENDQPVPYRQALIEWISFSDREGYLIFAEKQNRIRLDPSCKSM